MNEFRKPWPRCPSCLISFVPRQYPDDTQKQVEALCLKLGALDSMLVRLTPVQKMEAGDTGNVMLSLIDQMKTDAPLPMRYSKCEANIHNTLGRIVISEGTEESARRSLVVHFENALEVNEAIGFAGGVAATRRNIAFCKIKV